MEYKKGPYPCIFGFNVGFIVCILLYLYNKIHLKNRCQKKEKDWTAVQPLSGSCQIKGNVCISLGNYCSLIQEEGGEPQSQSCLRSREKILQSVKIQGARSAAAVGPLCFIKSNICRVDRNQHILTYFNPFLCWQARLGHCASRTKTCLEVVSYKFKNFLGFCSSKSWFQFNLLEFESTVYDRDTSNVQSHSKNEKYFLTLVLKARCPACCSCFTASTHLIQLITVSQKPVNQASIEISWAEARKHINR